MALFWKTKTYVPNHSFPPADSISMMLSGLNCNFAASLTVQSLWLSCWQQDLYLYVCLSVCYASVKYITHALSQITVRWSSQPYCNYPWHQICRVLLDCQWPTAAYFTFAPNMALTEWHRFWWHRVNKLANQRRRWKNTIACQKKSTLSAQSRFLLNMTAWNYGL